MYRDSRDPHTFSGRGRAPSFSDSSQGTRARSGSGAFLETERGCSVLNCYATVWSRNADTCWAHKSKDGPPKYTHNGEVFQQGEGWTTGGRRASTALRNRVSINSKRTSSYSYDGRRPSSASVTNYIDNNNNNTGDYDRRRPSSANSYGRPSYSNNSYDRSGRKSSNMPYDNSQFNLVGGYQDKNTSSRRSSRYEGGAPVFSNTGGPGGGPARPGQYGSSGYNTGERPYSERSGAAPAPQQPMHTMAQPVHLFDDEPGMGGSAYGDQYSSQSQYGNNQYSNQGRSSQYSNSYSNQNGAESHRQRRQSTKILVDKFETMDKRSKYSRRSSTKYGGSRRSSARQSIGLIQQTSQAVHGRMSTHSAYSNSAYSNSAPPANDYGMDAQQQRRRSTEMQQRRRGSTKDIARKFETGSVNREDRGIRRRQTGTGGTGALRNRGSISSPDMAATHALTQSVQRRTSAQSGHYQNGGTRGGVYHGDGNGNYGSGNGNYGGGSSFGGEESGCYLIWEEVDQGTLFTKWKRGNEPLQFSPRGSVVGYFRPGRQVYDSKYNSQKQVHMRCAAQFGVHVRNYFQGITQFVKDCRKWQGTLVVNPSTPISLYINIGGGVWPMGKEEHHDLSDKTCPGHLGVGVAVVGPSSQAFSGITHLQMGQFLAKGNSEGAALRM